MALLLCLIGYLISLAGLVYAIWAIQVLGFSRFCGLGVPSPSLILCGPYRFVRHPFYLGALAFLLGLFVATGDGIVAALVVFTIAATGLAIRIEEGRLLTCFGEAYRRYREAVPALVPRRRTIEVGAQNADERTRAS